MSGDGAIRELERFDADAWAALRAALWPDDATAVLAREAHDYFGRTREGITYLAFAADELIGFAEATIRHDYVNGTESSPVGFLEALVVVPTFRRRGVGRALVAKVESWTRSHGCVEFASDALLDNAISHAAHRAYGFEETERVVCFRKRI